MDEYTWASAVGRIRIKEKELLTHAFLLQMAEAEGLEAALASLRDSGYAPYIATLTNAQEFVAALEKALNGAYAYVMDISPEPFLAVVFRARHDFHNLKAFAKSAYLGMNVEEQALSTLGNLSIPLLREVPAADSAVPQALRHDVALEANAVRRAYGDAMSMVRERRDSTRPDMLALEVDSLIDGAHYTWATHVFRRAGYEGLAEFLASEVDVLNLRMAIRAARLRIDASLFGRIALWGGTVDPGSLTRSYEAGSGSIPDAYGGTKWVSLAAEGASRYAKNEPLTSWERKCDDAVMAVVKKARYYALGPEPVYGFIYGKETEVRNLRVVLSGKQSQASFQDISERLRDPYV